MTKDFNRKNILRVFIEEKKVIENFINLAINMLKIYNGGKVKGNKSFNIKKIKISKVQQH